MGSSVLFVLASVLIVANAAKIPSTWKTCKRSLPPEEYEKCIYEAVEKAVAEIMKTGVPTLNIPPLEPMKITALEIGQGTGPVAVEMKFQNIELSNLDSAKIIKIRHKDAENFKVGIDIALSKPLVVDADYELNGKVLVLPINGKGKCHFELDNFRASFELVGSPFKKKNVTYAKVDNFGIQFETDRFHVRFDNLFDGNKELGENMNVFLNENWDIFLKEMKPAIIEGVGASFRATSNQVFSKVPFREILPA